MTRLRYKRITVNNDELLVLTKPVITPHKIITVTIDATLLKAVISSNINSIATVEAVLSSSKDLIHLKKEVKLAITRLGANFEDEVRPGRSLKTSYEVYTDEVMDDLIHDQ